MSHTKPCPFCGSTEFESRPVEYLYRRDEKYLLVPDMPAMLCRKCGERYYDGASLLKVEQHFNAIHQHTEKPDRYLQVPVMEFSHAG